MHDTPKSAPPTVTSSRLAAIDIGTNSIRCIVVEVDAHGGFCVLDDEKAMVRLGEGLAESGCISDQARDRAIEALLRMKKICTSLNADIASIVATSAVRTALNRKQFLRAIKESTGLSIDIISGVKEAELARLSVQHNFDLEQMRHALADICGGSVEIVIATGEHIEKIISLELGAVLLSEKFIHHDPFVSEELNKLRYYIRKKLKKEGIGEGLPINCLIGSGGSITNIGSMVMAMRGEHYESVHRYEVFHSEVIHLLAMVTRKSYKERRRISGLNPERADIIIAGIILTDELMRRCRTNQLRINAQGIREGLILQGMQERGLLPLSRQTRDWRDSVLEFGQSCRFDEKHSIHVSSLALKLFAAVAQQYQLNDRDGQLLDAAALLHDIGYFISYDKHHKHSYHLIRHANLFGFTPREREVIANVARYHRRAKPKKSHDNFSHLNKSDQQLVRQLGGLLRLADGLDRRRNEQVADIDCRLVDGTFYLKLAGHGDLSVEKYGATSKSDLFRSAFSCRLSLSSSEFD